MLKTGGYKTGGYKTGGCKTGGCKTGGFPHNHPALFPFESELSSFAIGCFGIA